MFQTAFCRRLFVQVIRTSSLLLLFGLVGCQDDSAKAYGTLERDRILLTAVQNELITKVFVQSGQVVSKGTKLVQLQNVTAKAEVEGAFAYLQKAQANFEKLKHGARSETIAAMQATLQQAKAELDLQRITFTRAKRLANKDFQSKADFDKAKAQYEIALAKQNTFQAELNRLMNGSRVEDIAEAKAQVEIAKANLISKKQALSKLTIVATRDGIVEALPWHEGERVSVGAPVAVLLSGVRPFARVYIPQQYRAKLHTGAKLKILVDGYPTPFHGRIKIIANNPSFTPYYALNKTERDHLVYLAEVNLIDSNSEQLPSGLPVTVAL